MTESHITIAAGESASIQVVEAIAEAENLDMTDLPPLFEAIDSEALDAVVEDGGATVSFQYAGYTVEVRGRTEIVFQQIP